MTDGNTANDEDIIDLTDRPSVDDIDLRESWIDVADDRVLRPRPGVRTPTRDDRLLGNPNPSRLRRMLKRN